MHSLEHFDLFQAFLGLCSTHWLTEIFAGLAFDDIFIAGFDDHLFLLIYLAADMIIVSSSINAAIAVLHVEHRSPRTFFVL
jgi:hypothetical protein